MSRWSLGPVRSVVMCGALAASAWGQAGKPAMPPGVLTARTVAVVNDTRDAKVTEGAEAALKSWGQFTVVDDPDLADITLRFDKTRERDGENTQKTDPDTNKTSYGYSMSFTASIHMKAYLKDGSDPFYTTKTDDSKARAGMFCINDFHTAYRAARQAAMRRP